MSVTTKSVAPLLPGDFPKGERVDVRVPIYQDGLGNPMYCPFVVVRGAHPGPTLGLSAALHGDELNGIRVIHSLLSQLDPNHLHGAIICAPIVNVPSFQLAQRRFPEDDRDLNTVFPGKPGGLPSEQYAHAFATTFLPHLDYLLDFHTASEGRINSFYVRADLESAEARELALLMQPAIILHGRSGDRTLRSAARKRGIHAITVEAGNPSEFQGRMVDRGELGAMNILSSLNMWGVESAQPPVVPPILCKRSVWLRTQAGGLLDCEFALLDSIHRKQQLAHITDPYGHPKNVYRAPSDGVVIGMSRSPIAVPGTRYCHLGVLGDPVRTEDAPRGSER